MAGKPQFKANQLAKDLELKSKDIVDIMSEKGIEIKAQKALEPREFDILFDALTTRYQVECIDDYIDGITFIPSKLPKEAPKAEPSKKTESAAVETATKAPEKKETEKKEPEKKIEKAPETVVEKEPQTVVEKAPEVKELEVKEPVAEAPKAQPKPVQRLSLARRLSRRRHRRRHS